MNPLETHWRPFGAGDVPGVIELFADAFGRRISPAHYEWKLRTRESPVDNVTIAVNRQSRPVFHLGGVPCRCRLGGLERWAMIAVDGMTAPAHRRRGLLTQHTTELFGRWREAGVAVVLGLPNEQWGSRAEALGWRPLFPLSWLVLPLAPERVLARRLKVPLAGRLTFLGKLWNRQWLSQDRDRSTTVEELRSAGAELDALWLEAGAAIPHSIVRDRAWVAWRYLESPEVDYKVLVARRADRLRGYAAYRVHDGGAAKSATIAEVFTSPGDEATFGALVRQTLSRLHAQGVEVVRTLAVPGSAVCDQFRRRRFLGSGHSFSVEHVALDPALDRLNLQDPFSWYLTGGDFDVV